MPTSLPDPEIVAPSALLALEAEWETLWRRCPRATPFQHPAWLLSWARHHAPGRCGAVALRAGNRLVGLLPVFCWEGALLLAGTGPSDRGDALLEPGLEDHAVLLLKALPQAAPEPFDRIDLQQLAPDSPLLPATPEGWSGSLEDGDPCLLAPLEGDLGLAQASSRQRSHWRHALRQLGRMGGTVGLAAEDEIAAAIDDIIRLNALRWGEAGALHDRLLQATLRDAGPALHRAGLLRLHQVLLDDQRIAALMVLAGPWAHHGYNGGFDPAHARLSPSAILVGQAMSLAHREGRASFDFLRGTEGYKSVWGATPAPMHRRRLRPV